MEPWRAKVADRMAWALAPKTRGLYCRACKEFIQFFHSEGIHPPWPVQVDHVLRFVVHLQDKGLAAGSIQGKLAGLAFFLKAWGSADPTQDFRVRKLIEGWAKGRKKQPDERTPISPAMLSKLASVWPLLCANEYEASLFQAATLVAFFGAFRISELVGASKADKSCTALQRKDAQIFEDRVILHLRKSKTDQAAKGHFVTLSRCWLAEVCPVLALQSFLAKRGEKDGQLFAHIDGSPLTKFQFWSLTSRALGRAGWVGWKFGTHSFRIGAASTAAALGYSQEQIRGVGRWASKAYLGYVRHLPQ